jgi:hypothetical protein
VSFQLKWLAETRASIVLKYNREPPPTAPIPIYPVGSPIYNQVYIF